MKALIIFFLTLGLLNCQAVISRNGKVQEMIDQLQQNEEFYTEMIDFLDEKMKSDYHNCTAEIKEQNCSDSQIWEQQRSKNSKNITNLQEKISKQNKTIDAILQLNKQEVTKKNLTMAMMFPQVEKLKNDIELIENMLFLVEDTYLNLDNEGKSILLIFDHQFLHPKAQQLQKSFIQLMHRRASMKEGPPPTEEPENTTETVETVEVEEESNESENSNNNEDVPLIDEDIFHGEVDQQEVKVDNLFLTTEEDKKQEAELVADDIPDGVNVKEHDDSDENSIDGTQQTTKEEEYEDLRIYEVKEDFKSDIKALGKVIHDRLSELLESLTDELDMRTQSVADLEKAIIDLHHKHAKQIVQIYIETKKLQQQVFELDDEVMSLDAKIYDCLNSDKQLQECEDRKGLDQIVLDDLKTEKSFNDAALIELQKLIEFEDRNVYEPEPRVQEKNEQILSEEEQKKQEEQVKEQNDVENRIQQIKNEEAIVDQQIQDQEEQKEQISLAHPELREQSQVIDIPEHLADVPEFKGSVLFKKQNKKEEAKTEKEEDKVLQKVNKELGDGYNYLLIEVIIFFLQIIWSF